MTKKLKHSEQSAGVESKRGRRSFSSEFKHEAVRLMKERRGLGVSLAQVGREVGIRPDQLRRWAREMSPPSNGSSVAGSNGPIPEEELRRLRRENETLRQERDFLKKAAAFFAKESR